MRILHVVHQYPPDAVGGVELYTQRMARASLAAGDTVAVLTRTGGKGHGLAQKDEAGVQVWRAWDGPMTPTRRYLDLFRTGPLLDAWEEVLVTTMPDVVHIQHLMGWPLAILDQLIAAKAPYVIMLYDYWWRCANAQLLTNYDERVCAGPRGCANCTRCAVARAGVHAWPAAPALWGSLLWRNRRLARGLRHAHTLVAPTPFVADWYAGQGISRATMRLVPPGVEPMPRLARPPRQADGKLRAAYIGGLASQKGVHVAVEAASRLAGLVDLTVAGHAQDPAYEAHLRDLAGANVRFVGRLNRAAVWSLLASVDVVLVPSLWYETYCYVLHEAFAAGVPVIASDLGVMADAVRDGVDGLLVPPGDVAAWTASLERLAREPALRAHLAANVPQPPDEADHAEALRQIYLEAAASSIPQPARLKAQANVR